jgi:hypothetical protein
LTDAAKEAKLGAHVALVSTRFRSFAPGGGLALASVIISSASGLIIGPGAAAS